MSIPTLSKTPSLGLRFFNSYTGPRQEKADQLERFGAVYSYCLKNALGNQIKLNEDRPCEIKNTHKVLRILFGIAAVATLPFTLVGFVLTALSKTQKKVHQTALDSLKVKITKTQLNIQVSKTATQTPQNASQEQPKINQQKPIENWQSKVTFITPQPTIKAPPPPTQVEINPQTIEENTSPKTPEMPTESQSQPQVISQQPQVISEEAKTLHNYASLFMGAVFLNVLNQQFPNQSIPTTTSPNSTTPSNSTTTSPEISQEQIKAIAEDLSSPLPTSVSLTKEETVVVQPTIDTPQTLVFPEVESNNFEVIKAFIQKNLVNLKESLLEHYLVNLKREPSKKIRKDDQVQKQVVFELIKQMDELKIPYFSDKYRENDAFSLAIKYDRTDNYEIINKMIEFLKKHPNIKKDLYLVLLQNQSDIPVKDRNNLKNSIN